MSRDLAVRILRQRASKLRQEAAREGVGDVQLVEMKKHVHSLGAVFIVWIKTRLASELESIAFEIEKAKA